MKYLLSLVATFGLASLSLSQTLTLPDGFLFSAAGTTFTAEGVSAVRRNLPYDFPDNGFIADAPSIEVDISGQEITAIEVDYVDNCGPGCTAAQILEGDTVLLTLENPISDGLPVETFSFSNIPEDATTLRLFALETDFVEIRLSGSNSNQVGFILAPSIARTEEGCINVSWASSALLVLERTSNLLIPFVAVPESELQTEDGTTVFKQQLLNEQPAFFYRLRRLTDNTE